MRLVSVPLLDGILSCSAEHRLVVRERSGLLSGLPFVQGSRGVRLLEGALEFNLAGYPAVGVDLEVEPGVFLGPVAAEPVPHGLIVRDSAVGVVRSQVLRPYADGVFVGVQVQPRLVVQEVFPTGLPREGSVAVGPDDLEDRERRLAVVADRGSEERLVPAVVDGSEDNGDACDVVPFLVCLQRLSFNGLLTEVVEDGLHQADVQAEHCKLGYPVAVPQADGVGPAGSLVVGGDHRDLPALLMDGVDGRLGTGVQFVDVPADDAVAGGVTVGHGREATGAVRPQPRQDRPGSRIGVGGAGVVDDVGVARATEPTAFSDMSKNVRSRLKQLRSALTEGRRRDCGSMSLFFAVTTVAILMVMGLLVDGGGALNASNRATSLAQEAARTAGQQLDPAQAIEGTAITIDPDAAQAAAQDYLAAAGVQGDVTIDGTGRTLTVTVHDTYHTYFAQLVGKGTINVTGTATAHLQTQAGG